jgi:hypothetical protein
MPHEIELKRLVLQKLFIESRILKTESSGLKCFFWSKIEKNAHILFLLVFPRHRNLEKSIGTE